MRNRGRRNFLHKGAASCILLAASPVLTAKRIIRLDSTPHEIEGPFYPVYAQKDKDFDLTKVEGNDGVAKGEVIIVEGVVTDTKGRPLEDVTVDLWQANAYGRYRHPHDSGEGDLDPNFQGWAIVPSGKNGAFRFKTIFPGAYPIGRDRMRTPHIHFKITGRGYKSLTTQMYFPGHELNREDGLYSRKREAEQKLLTAKLSKGKLKRYSWQLVLEKA